MTENISFNRGNFYEEVLAWALITDNSFAEQMFEVLDVNYFSLEYLKEVVNVTKKHYDEFKCFPSVKLLFSIVTKDVQNELVKDQCTAFLKKMYKEPINGDMEYVKQTSLDFCKKRSLMVALNKVLELAEQSNFDQIASVVQKSLELGSDKNVGHVYEDLLEYRMVGDIRKPILTGWKNIDKIIGGGLGAGEIGVLVGPTGVGKSRGLVNLGKNAVKAGYSVVHFSLELSEKYLGKVYDSSFIETPLDQLSENKEKIKNMLETVKPKLLIKSFPTKSASGLTLRNHLSRLKVKGTFPDLVIVDYADIMRSTRNYRDKRFEHESIYEDLRALAMELNVPIWTCSQANRASLDEEVISLSRIAESYAKATVADLIITMSKSNFYVAKNRFGPSNVIFPINNNTEIANIEVFDQASEKDLPTLGEMSDLEREAYRRKVKDFLNESGRN